MRYMKQVFIGTTGHWAAGKTTLARKLAKRFDMDLIRGDAVRDFLIKEISFYKDAQYSHHNPLIDSANKVGRKFKLSLMKELIKQGRSVLVDSAGYVKEKRKVHLNLVKKINPKIITILINTQENNNIIVERLKERDRKMGWKWEETHDKIRKKTFQEPTSEEADHILTFDQKNYDEIVSKLEKIFS